MTSPAEHPVGGLVEPSRPDGDATGAASAPVIAAAVSAAVAVALPGFLVGALSVQVRGTFAVGEATYGWAMSSYFLAATAGSIGLGRLAQRVGPRRQITVALIGAAAVDLAIATTARSFGTLVALLAVVGFCNAGCQTAVNLALAQARLPRLGLAIALKQSGMPAASMLSGLAVPAIALTLGWRWAFAGAAIVALGAIAAIRATVVDVRDEVPAGEAPDARTTLPVGSSIGVLVAAAVSAAFLSFGAGSLNAWIVESGVDAGLAEGTAGLMLSIGAAMGVACRVGWGVRLDRMQSSPFRIAGVMALAGAAGVALLSSRSASVHIAATAIAFVGGWVWPVFTNFGIVRANAGNAAAATGITQTGVYVGVFAAPLTAGALIERGGYPTMWIVTAIAMAIGALVAIGVADHFRSDSTAGT